MADETTCRKCLGNEVCIVDEVTGELHPLPCDEDGVIGFYIEDEVVDCPDCEQVVLNQVKP